MTNAELHAHFTQLLVGHAHDVDTCLGDVDSKLFDAMEKIDGLEVAFNTKLDAKFQEVLAGYHHNHNRASTCHMHTAFLSHRYLRVPLQLWRPQQRRPPRMDMLLTKGRTSLKTKMS
jgi:hypothetical protein